MLIYNLENIKSYQTDESLIIKAKKMGNNNTPNYLLRNKNGLNFRLSNGDIINIPENYCWDGSSVPRIFWWFFSPDGDFEIASLIHDFLYENKKNLKYDRKFADKEMFIWSNVVNGTNKRSFRNFDNKIRYYFVRMFGSFVWNKRN